MHVQWIWEFEMVHANIGKGIWTYPVVKMPLKKTGTNLQEATMEISHFC